MINKWKKISLEKRYIILSIIFIFLGGFLTHNIYKWFPCAVTSIFPVNESLFEHLKMIFLTPLIVCPIIYFIYRKRYNLHFNNFLGGVAFSTILNILSFYIVFLPIYNMIGQNMAVTLITYFLSIVVSQIFNYIIISKKQSSFSNIVGGVLLLLIFIATIYYTYNPIKNEFFRDPIDNIYGIPKNK